MEEDIFSRLKDDGCLTAILLYVGPRPRAIGALFMASPYVRQRFSTSYFARKFLSFYLGVNVSAPLTNISWWDELKQWFARRNELYDTKFNFQGEEVDQLENGDGDPIVTVKQKSNGTITAERTFKTAPLSESMSESTTNTFADIQMTIMQPKCTSIARLPLSRAHGMYYEVKVAKSVPKRGGAIIGYALPSLKVTLPGRTSCSFGVALDTLIVFKGFSHLPERIPSPRGETFKLKKGDTFGVGVVYSLSNLRPPYESHLTSTQARCNLEPNHVDNATFYVTFNGQLIYHKADVFCTYQLAPSFVLPSYGDAIRINFGIPSMIPTWMDHEGIFKHLMSGNSDTSIEPLQIYDNGWKFDPRAAHEHLPPECFTDRLSLEGQENVPNENVEDVTPETVRLLGPKVKRNFYWQSLKEQDEVIGEATAERLWQDPCFHHFARHHQRTLDFLQLQIDEKKYIPLFKLENISKCLESANMQRLVTSGLMSAERARTLMIPSLSDEQEIQTLLDCEDPIEVFVQWTESLMRYWERRLAWELISFLKFNQGPAVKSIDQPSILFCWVVLDMFTFWEETQDSPVYGQLETVAQLWYGETGLESAVVNMLKAVTQAYWMSRVLHLDEDAWTYKKPSPLMEFLGAHWTTHTLMSFGLLPREDHLLPDDATCSPLTKEDVAAIYNSLSEAEQTDLIQAALCAFICCFCAHHAPTSQTEPWLPPDPVDAIKAAIDVIVLQRSKFRKSKEFESTDLSVTHVYEIAGSVLLGYRKYAAVIPTVGRASRSRSGSLAASASAASSLSSTLTLNPALPDLAFTKMYWHFSRVSDRFALLLNHVSSVGPHASLSPIAAEQLQNHLNEKCSWLNFWYGEQRFAQLVQIIFPESSTSLLCDYKLLNIYGRLYDIKHGPYQGRSVLTSRWGLSRLTMGVLAVGLVSAGVAISAVAFTRARRIFTRKR